MTMPDLAQQIALKMSLTILREIFSHPPYSSDIVPSDFPLFPKMKSWLATQRFDDDAELQAGLTYWLKS